MEAFAGLLLLILIPLHFLPTFIAFMRAHTNRWAIFLLNLFLGWTLIGWVAALCWSVLSRQEATA